VPSAVNDGNVQGEFVGVSQYVIPEFRDSQEYMAASSKLASVYRVSIWPVFRPSICSMVRSSIDLSCLLLLSCKETAYSKPAMLATNI